MSQTQRFRSPGSELFDQECFPLCLHVYTCVYVCGVCSCVCVVNMCVCVFGVNAHTRAVHVTRRGMWVSAHM